MAKPLDIKKKTSPVFWVALLGGCIALYLVMDNEDPSKAIKKPKRLPPPLAGKGDIYTKGDYTAKFERISWTPKNAFHPLVVRSRLAGLPGGILIGGVPALLADGESDWTYTGMVILDNLPLGLLENSKGDSVYLGPGEKWKHAQVVSVSSENIAFTGPDGNRVVVPMGDKTSQGSADNGIDGKGIAPMPVSPLRGSIGPLTVTPIPGNPATSNFAPFNLGSNPPTL